MQKPAETRNEGVCPICHGQKQVKDGATVKPCVRCMGTGKASAYSTKG